MFFFNLLLKKNLSLFKVLFDRCDRVPCCYWVLTERRGKKISNCTERRASIFDWVETFSTIKKKRLIRVAFHVTLSGPQCTARFPTPCPYFDSICFQGEERETSCPSALRPSFCNTLFLLLFVDKSIYNQWHCGTWSSRSNDVLCTIADIVEIWSSTIYWYRGVSNSTITGIEE